MKVWALGLWALGWGSYVARGRRGARDLRLCRIRKDYVAGLRIVFMTLASGFQVPDGNSKPGIADGFWSFVSLSSCFYKLTIKYLLSVSQSYFPLIPILHLKNSSSSSSSIETLHPSSPLIQKVLISILFVRSRAVHTLIQKDIEDKPVRKSTSGNLYRLRSKINMRQFDFDKKAMNSR